MQNTQTDVRTQCPECSSPVFFPQDVELGEILECQHCGVELEVKNISPPMVMIFEEEEK